MDHDSSDLRGTQRFQPLAAAVTGAADLFRSSWILTCFDLQLSFGLRRFGPMKTSYWSGGDVRDGGGCGCDVSGGG